MARRGDHGRGPSATGLASAGIVAITAPFLFIGVGFAHDALQAEATIVATLAAVALLGMSALTIVLAVGVRRRREGAHLAAIAVFAVFAVVTALVALVGLSLDPPARHALWWLGVAVADAVILWLLLRRATWDAVDDAEARRRTAGVLPPWA